jgi:hypothetical protein
VSSRQSGKTTRMIANIAAMLEAEPDTTVILTGAHVVHDKRRYEYLLREAGVDLKRVRIVPVPSLDRAVRGSRAKLICDDYRDLDWKSQAIVDDAWRFLRPRR